MGIARDAHIPVSASSLSERIRFPEDQTKDRAIVITEKKKDLLEITQRMNAEPIAVLVTHIERDRHVCVE